MKPVTAPLAEAACHDTVVDARRTAFITRYVARCRCGWTGAPQVLRLAARVDAAEHCRRAP